MRKRWDHKFDSLLGKMSDIDVAQIAKLPEWTITNWRRKYRIKAFKFSHPTWKEIIGKMSDNELTDTPLEKFKRSQRDLLYQELRRRGLRRQHRKIKVSFSVGTDSLRTTMIKAAFKMSPQPTLAEVGRILKITRERVRQILKSGTRRK